METGLMIFWAMSPLATLWSWFAASRTTTYSPSWTMPPETIWPALVVIMVMW